MRIIKPKMEESKISLQPIMKIMVEINSLSKIKIRLDKHKPQMKILTVLLKL